MVPYGGLSSISLRPGETIIIAPATGSFGSAAVKLSLGMGARVIAIGRSSSSLAALSKQYNDSRLVTVPITGDVAADLKSLQAYGTIDVFFDISPPEATDSTHFKSSILSLRKGGRVCLMGGLKDDLGIPVRAVMSRDLTIKGKWMYERSDVRELIQMIELGILKLGGHKLEKFGLEEWEKGFDAATEMKGSDGMAVICP
jgi:threonine dehydrogenase-like Zn-dependent dehydrogenase